MDTNTPADQPENTNDQEKCTFPKEITVKYDHKPFDNLSESIDNQTSALQCVNRDSSRIPEGQLKEQRSANKIAITATWVNGILMLITAAVFALSAISLWLSRRDVVDATKQFEISNRPFIAIGDVKIDSIEPGQKPTIRFNFYNSGKFPAKIISFLYIKGMGPVNVPDNQIKPFLETGVPKQGSATNIIISSLPIVLPQWITDFTPISKDESDSIKKGEKIIFLSVEIKYRNFLTNKAYFKKEIYKIAAGPILSMSLIDATETNF